MDGRRGLRLGPYPAAIPKLAIRRKVVVIPELVNCHEIVLMQNAIRNTRVAVQSAEGENRRVLSARRRIMATCAEVCGPRGFFPRAQAYPRLGDNGGASAIEGRYSRRMRDCYGDSVAIAASGLVPIGAATGARHALSKVNNRESGPCDNQTLLRHPPIRAPGADLYLAP
jgi:hypothetical protein